MPHPRYLKSFTSSVGTGCSGIDNSHISYLRTKINSLQDHEKLVNLLADEVYVKPGLIYKGSTVD